MVWTKPKGYSKSKVDWAGDTLIDEASSSHDKEIALEIYFAEHKCLNSGK